VLEGLIVIVVLATVLAGAALPASTSVGGGSPTSIAAVLLWLCGPWMVNRSRFLRLGIDSIALPVIYPCAIALLPKVT
jgi:hypothetical protein